MTVDLESAIEQFLGLARELQAQSGLTAEAVLARVTRFYRDVRIDGAALDADGDMLLLQWGATCPIVGTEPADLRHAGDVAATYDIKQRYLDITRQVFAAGDGVDDGEDEEEFDDAAVQLSITLVYGPATGDEPSSNQWIDHPDNLVDGLEQIRKVPFVKELLGAAPTRLVATVDRCG